MSGAGPATETSDYYETLGLQRSATQKQIRRAFRHLARQWHPDANPNPIAETRFKALSLAYHVLSDPRQRAEYDFKHPAAGRFGSAPGRTQSRRQRRRKSAARQAREERERQAREERERQTREERERQAREERERQAREERERQTREERERQAREERERQACEERRQAVARATEIIGQAKLAHHRYRRSIGDHLYAVLGSQLGGLEHLAGDQKATTEQLKKATKALEHIVEQAAAQRRIHIAELRELEQRRHEPQVNETCRIVFPGHDALLIHASARRVPPSRYFILKWLLIGPYLLFAALSLIGIIAAILDPDNQNATGSTATSVVGLIVIVGLPAIITGGILYMAKRVWMGYIKLQLNLTLDSVTVTRMTLTAFRKLSTFSMGDLQNIEFDQDADLQLVGRLHRRGAPPLPLGVFQTSLEAATAAKILGSFLNIPASIMGARE